MKALCAILVVAVSVGFGGIVNGLAGALVCGLAAMTWVSFVWVPSNRARIGKSPRDEGTVIGGSGL
jgi:hypothetical protein